MLRLRSICAVLIVIMLSFSVIYSQSWVEKAKAEKESAMRYSYQGTAGGNSVRALTDFENQFMEFEASGTVNMDEMENDVQAEIMAEQAASLRAYAEAARFISGILVSAVYGVEKGLAKDEVVVGKVEKTLIKYAKVVDKKVEWRNKVPVGTVKIGILFQKRNGLVDMVIPILNEQTQKLGISAYKPSQTVEASSTQYTGVIIDARGLNVKPSIAPMILTGSDNRQIYGNLKISKDYAIEKGIAGYFKSVEDAKKDVDRLGSNPLVIKGAKTVITDHHIWISEDDATRIYSADLKNGFLKECRVGIVVD